VRLIVVPESHRQKAEAAVLTALAEQGAASDAFAFTLILLPGRQEWSVHASSAAGRDDELAELIQRKLREVGL
jgi:hypothetical protein